MIFEAGQARLCGDMLAGRVLAAQGMHEDVGDAQNAGAARKSHSRRAAFCYR
jgi:hypothetical protein